MIAEPDETSFDINQFVNDTFDNDTFQQNFDTTNKYDTDSELNAENENENVRNIFL